MKTTFTNFTKAAIKNLLLCCLLACAAICNVQAQSNLTVTNTNDAGTGSLRNAIGTASILGPSIITFSGITYPATIRVTSGELVITSDVTIIGPGSSNLNISGNGGFRVFRLPFSNSNVTMSDLSITNGFAPPFGNGGAILNTSKLTQTNCNITNSKGIKGGGIYNDGTLTQINCIISGNATNNTSGNGFGGGIYNASGGIVIQTKCSILNNRADGGAGIRNEVSANGVGSFTQTDCAVSSNTSAFNSGGISNDGTFMQTNCTIANNICTSSSGIGGGIFNSKTLTQINCTIANNTTSSMVGAGGGIYNSGDLFQTNCTIHNNTASPGGGAGIFNLGIFMSATTAKHTLKNTIINNSVYNSRVTITSQGNNICSTNDMAGAFNTANGDKNNTNPLLAALADNGGPTQTCALLVGSPAIDAGTATGAPTTDQRGVARQGATDIGAFEYVNACPATASTFTAAACGSYTWVAKQNTVYTTSNTTDTIKLVNAVGCDSIITLNLTINPIPIAPTAAAQSFCVSANPTVANLTPAIGTTIKWYAAATGGMPLASTIALATGTYYATQSSAACESARTAVAVTVNPIPDVTQPNNLVVCNNSATAVNFSGSVAGTSYSWTNNNTTIGLAASGTGNIASFTATNSTAIPIVASITVTPSAGTGAAGNATSISMPPETSVFNGQARGYWFTAPTNFTITSLQVPTTASSGTQNIAVLRFAGNTPPPEFLGTTNLFTTLFLTQNNATAGNIAVNIPISAGEVIGILGDRDNIISYGNGSAGITIAGFPVNTTRMGMQFALSSNVPQSVFQNSASTNISRVLFEYTFAVPCTGASKIFTYTVNPTPVGVPAQQTICGGTTSSVALSANTATANTSYSWTAAILTTPAGGTITGFSNCASACGTTIAQTLNNTGTSFGVVRYTVTPIYTNAGVSCNGATFIVDVRVDACCPTIPNLSTNPTSAVCSGANVALAATALTNMSTGPYGIVFKYFAAPTATPYVGGTVIATVANSSLTSGGTIASASSTTIPAGTQYIYAVLTPTPTDAACRPAATATFTVNPIATVNAIANQVTCNNTPTITAAFTSTTTGGTIVYNWTNNTTSIGLVASGIGNINSFVTVNTTTVPITATITVTPTFTNAGVSCVGTPSAFTITVNPTVTVNAIANQVVCNNTGTIAVTFGTTATGGTTTYAWTNNTTSIGLAASGTGTFPSFAATNSTNAPITATITVTPTFTNAGVSCVGTPRTFTITVNPIATVNAIANQVVCNSTGTTAVTFGTTATGGTTTYAWTNNTTSIGLAASGTGTFPSFAATNSTNAPITATITVTPTFTNAGVSCVGTPTTFTITVNPTVTVNGIANQLVCNNTGTIAVTFGTTSTGGTTTYAWTNNTTSIGLAASGTGTFPSFAATNSTNAPITATITVTPTFTNTGISCVGTLTTFTITVNPTVTVNGIANQLVCNNTGTIAVTFGTTATGGNTTYTWANNTTSIGLAASGTETFPSFAATNSTNAPITATITITPTFTNAGLSCVGTPRTFTIAVNPIAIVNTVTNQTLCNNFPTTAVNFSSPTTGGTIVYNWVNNTPSIGLAATGSGNIPSFTANNISQVQAIATITVTPTFTNGGVNCVGTPITYTYTVNPTPIVTLAAFVPICKNAVAITLSGGSPINGTGGTGFYTVNNVVQTIFNPANYTPGLHTIVYQFTNTFGCVNSATQQILVHPIHNVELTIAPNTGLAPGQPATAIATVLPANNYTYVWTNNNLPVIAAANADRIRILANDAGTYKVTVTAPTGCVVASTGLFTESQVIPKRLYIFPNPTSGIFNVAYNNGAANPIARTLNVYDAKGAWVFTQRYAVNVPFGNMKVDISRYASGHYEIMLVDSKGVKLSSTKILKL